MSTAIMASIPQEQFVQLKKGTLENLKCNFEPSLEAPFKVYLYCAKFDWHHWQQQGIQYRSNAEAGKVFAQFICDKVNEDGSMHITELLQYKKSLEFKWFRKPLKGNCPNVKGRKCSPECSYSRACTARRLQKTPMGRQLLVEEIELRGENIE